MSAFGEVGWGDELTFSIRWAFASGCRGLVPVVSRFRFGVWIV